MDAEELRDELSDMLPEAPWVVFNTKNDPVMMECQGCGEKVEPPVNMRLNTHIWMCNGFRIAHLECGEEK